MNSIAINEYYKKHAWITPERYQSLYLQSINEPETFWAQQAVNFLDFKRAPRRTLTGPFHACRWFEDGTLNASYQCIDRHLPKRAQQPAILWEGDEPNQQRTLTYQNLHDEVCRMANVMKKHGIKKGDRVCIYLPMIPEAVVAMLACARIGAVHSVVFAGFSPEALKQRIVDAACKLLITTMQAQRGGKCIALGENAAKAVGETTCLQHVLLIESEGANVYFDSFIDWQQAKPTVAPDCPPEEMGSEDPLFILYTSGSTGKPKGILHTTAGYLLYAAMTHKYVFDYHDGDVYWCGADVGWITGHSYIVYGPLANGATSVIFAGTPTYPTPARYWQIIDKYQVNIFYTAPTAIRTLMKEGDEWLQTTTRSSLRLLGSVGEPINPDVWLWYYRYVGKEQAPVMDTWWQTETGGIMVSPLPGVTRLKPGFAQQPFFGVLPTLLDDKGHETKGTGRLAIKQPWPGLARTIYGDEARYLKTYFNHGYYVAGDEALQDDQGNYQILGRVDDVLNVSGHRLGTAEVENAIIEHPAVAESAVVGMKHAIKGEAIYAFVTLKQGVASSELLKQEICQQVRKAIGPIATPDIIQWADELPKTRSGKIMRRILRKIANEQFDNLGDLSTLATPQAVENLIQKRNSASAETR